MKKLIATLLFVSACGGSSVGDCPTGSEATQAEGKMILTNTCATCHSSMTMGAGRAGAPTDVNFDTPAGTKANLDAAYDQASSGTMPPGAKLSAEQLEKLRVYLACGAS